MKYTRVGLRTEGNVFNDAFNRFYIWLYGIKHGKVGEGLNSYIIMLDNILNSILKIVLTLLLNINDTKLNMILTGRWNEVQSPQSRHMYVNVISNQ